MSDNTHDYSNTNPSDKQGLVNTNREEPPNNNLDDSRENLIQSSYNPLASPPDINKARKHGRARSVGRINVRDTKFEYCEDCGLPIENDPLPVCGSRIDLAELGSGFPLFFEYLLFCGVLLILLFLIVGIYGIVANHKGDVCTIMENDAEYPCTGGFITTLSLGNRNPLDSLNALNILSLVFVVIGSVVSVYYRRLQAMTADEVDRGTTTASDYAVMVKHIPQGETAESIKAFFEGTGRNKTTVKRVTMAYNITPYVELMRRKTKLVEKKKSGKYAEEIDQEIIEVEEKLKNFEGEIANKQSHKFLGIAFVVFNTQKEASETVAKYEMTRLQRALYTLFAKSLNCLGCVPLRTYKGAIIDMKRAPEPLDVFWENLGYKWWDVTKKRLVTGLASLVLIACTFGLILGVNSGQDKIKENASESGILILSVVCSLIINIFNGGLDFFIRKLSAYEKHPTYTYFFVSVAKKLSYAQFVNTAIVTLLVQLVINDGDIRLWTAESMVSKVFFLFVLNIFLPSFSYYLNPFYVLRLYKRYRLAKDGTNSKLTQQEANLLFEGPPIDMAQRYAVIQKTMLFTAFYANLVPLGILFSIAGLFIIYWTNKYLFLRRHSMPNTLGKELAEQMSDFLELFFVVFASGNLIFEKIQTKETSALNWITFIIACVFYLLPQNFVGNIFRKKTDIGYNTKTYDEVRFSLITEYDRVNPITQAEATRDWIAEMAKLAEVNENDSSLEKSQKANLNNYLQHLPKQTTFSTINNYANYNPSLNQMNNYNSNANYMIFRPQMRAQLQMPVFQNFAMNRSMMRPQVLKHIPANQMTRVSQQFNQFTRQINHFASHLPNQIQQAFFSPPQRVQAQPQMNRVVPQPQIQYAPQMPVQHIQMVQQPMVPQQQYPMVNPVYPQNHYPAQNHLPYAQPNVFQPAPYQQNVYPMGQGQMMQAMNQPGMMPGYYGQPQQQAYGVPMMQGNPGYYR